MEPSSISLGDKTATFLDFPGDGPAAHFYHANGFPAGVYRQFLKKLAPTLKISALNFRPCWPDIGSPPRKLNWQVYANDLISFLDSQTNGPVIGMGHSMGATSTLMAAALRPDLFKALVLIEPASLSVTQRMIADLLPYNWFRFLKVVKGALERQERWESPAAFFDRYRSKRVFKRIPDEMLHDLANFSLVPHGEGGYELAFPRTWEAHNYTQAPVLWPWLKQVKLPILAIKGGKSVFLSDSIWDKWQSRGNSQTSFLEMKDVGHLVPLEDAKSCSESILNFVENL